MYFKWLFLISFSVGLLVAPNAEVNAQDAPSNEQLERRIQFLENRIDSTRSKLEMLEDEIEGLALLAFLYGAFCALWAQNTGRSAWLWFFMGVLFSFITLLVLLVKNSNARHNRAG